LNQLKSPLPFPARFFFQRVSRGLVVDGSSSPSSTPQPVVGPCIFSRPLSEVLLLPPASSRRRTDPHFPFQFLQLSLFLCRVRMPPPIGSQALFFSLTQLTIFLEILVGCTLVPDPRNRCPSVLIKLLPFKRFPLSRSGFSRVALYECLAPSTGSSSI